VETNNALYFPTIEFRNPRWLWSAALLWDRIYRIVPEGYSPMESQNIHELMEDGTIGANINPTKYSPEVAELFVKKYNGNDWYAPSLGNYELMSEKYINVHQDKVDARLSGMLLAKGKKNSEWLEVPEHIAALYMLFLSNHIAEKNNLTLVSDDVGAWAGSNYFFYDGKISNFEEESSTQLASIIIQDFIPQNILDITPKQLLKFREIRKNERQRFFTSIQNLSNSISKCTDQQVIGDVIADYQKEILTSVREFKKSIDMIRVQNWMGVKSLLIPVAAPVMNSFFQLPENISKYLGLAGIGIGVVGSLLEQNQRINNLKQNYEFNYLLELKNQVERNHIVWNNYGEYSEYINYYLDNFIND